MTRRFVILLVVAATVVMACTRPDAAASTGEPPPPEPSTASSLSPTPAPTASSEDNPTPSVRPFHPGGSGSILVVRVDEGAGGVLVISIAPDGSETVAAVVPSLADALGEWRLPEDPRFIVGLNGLLVAPVEGGDIDDLAAPRGNAVFDLGRPDAAATILPAGRVTVAPNGEIVLVSDMQRTIRRITDLSDPDGPELALPGGLHTPSLANQAIPLLADGSGMVVVSLRDAPAAAGPAILLWDGSVESFEDSLALFLPTGTERPYGRGTLNAFAWSETTIDGGSTGFAVQDPDRSRTELDLGGGNDIEYSVWNADGSALYVTGGYGVHRWLVGDPNAVRIASLESGLSAGPIAALTDQRVVIAGRGTVEIVDLEGGPSSMIDGFVGGVVP